MRRHLIMAALAAGVLATLAAGADESIAPAPITTRPRTGELHFRRGNFDQARAAFEAAVQSDPDDARSWWGLGRIEEIHFRRDRARDLFAKAYRLDPRDPDILLSYLEYVADPPARAILLRNVASLSRDSNPDRAAAAIAQLAI